MTCLRYGSALSAPASKFSDLGCTGGGGAALLGSVGFTPLTVEASIFTGSLERLLAILADLIVPVRATSDSSRAWSVRPMRLLPHTYPRLRRYGGRLLPLLCLLRYRSRSLVCRTESPSGILGCPPQSSLCPAMSRSLSEYLRSIRIRILGTSMRQAGR